MNKLIFILTLVASFTFAQSSLQITDSGGTNRFITDGMRDDGAVIYKGNAKDTIKVKPNAVQMNIISDLEKKLAQAEAELNRLKEQHKNSIELIIGVRIEEIEYLNYKNNQFEYIPKTKTK